MRSSTTASSSALPAAPEASKGGGPPVSREPARVPVSVAISRVLCAGPVSRGTRPVRRPFLCRRRRRRRADRLGSDRPHPTRPHRRTDGAPRGAQGSAWACTRWGLPCPGCHHPSGALLPHPFTLTCAPVRAGAIGGLLSVALSLGRLTGLPRVGVTHHRVLPCSDFPQVGDAPRPRPPCDAGESIPRYHAPDAAVPSQRHRVATTGTGDARPTRLRRGRCRDRECRRPGTARPRRRRRA
jgi:hypothetical protein